MADTSTGFVGAPPDLPFFGDVQYEDAGAGWGRGQIGGDWPEWGMNPNAGGENAGFERISTGVGLGEPVPGAGGNKVTDWRALFNYQHNPTFWILLFALAAVGFIHARIQVGGSAGRFGGGGGVRV